MKNEEIDILLEQIRSIILNKPISNNTVSDTGELAELQEAITYLSNCLSEANEFLKHLSQGELEVKPPSRHNFLVGSLKELHAGLKHLTWQASQVTKGDYNQRVSFLGEFSDSFNKMVGQLSERENRLRGQSSALAETNNLLRAIMDGLKEWIVVTSMDTGEILYANQSAQYLFYDTATGEHICKKQCELMEDLRQQNRKHDMNEELRMEFSCPFSNKELSVKSYLVQWNGNLAYAHCITDVTYEKEYQEQMETMAYKDELTGLYNRRHCTKYLDSLLIKRKEFVFCILDLDGLKFANDNFGHLKGDEYLVTVAQGMSKIANDKDIVCRIGGDEFAMIFPNCDEKTIENKLIQLDESLISLSKEYPMSVSYGVIHVDGGTKILSETVMAQADEKMYVLKNIKRNEKRLKKELT